MTHDHPVIGTPEWMASARALDAKYAAEREARGFRGIHPEARRRLEQLSADMVEAGYPFPLEETEQRVLALRASRQAAE